MSFYSTSEMRQGLRVLLKGEREPYVVIENEMVKPGKGQAFNRLKLRHLRTGRIYERTLKSGERLEAADVVEIEMQYSYNDGSHWYFMDPSTYEQHAIGADAMPEDKVQWLKEEDAWTIVMWNDHPLSVIPPHFVTLKVVETNPGVKGDTVSGGSKPIKLETGAVIRGPLFIANGDWLRIDTRTGECKRVSEPSEQ